MVFTSSVDRYDELRREWIAEHAGIFSMQIRRAELLNRRIRRRARDVAGARPSPYNDHPSHPLLTRGVKTVEGVLEVVIVFAAAVLAPLGWPLGKLIYHRSESLIPDRLRSFPIPAFLWAAVALGVLLVLLYRPSDTLPVQSLRPGCSHNFQQQLSQPESTEFSTAGWQSTVQRTGGHSRPRRRQ